MKTIAVATDLTPNGNRAAHFALQLAHVQRASLLLINVFHFWPLNPAETGGDFPLSAQAMHDDSQRALKHLARELHGRYGNEVTIRCLTRQGHPIPAILEAAQDEHVDLLIMSTVGSAPQSAQIMGSVASDMVTKTHVPLLLVPPSTDYAAINNVVLGIDLDLAPNAVVFDTTLHFARQFGCAINVLCVHDNPADTAVQHRAEHIRHLMATVPHTLTILPGSKVYDLLLTFAHRNKADLIIMLPQAHNWLRQIFVDGETQRMARLTDIPLLAIV
jgi:nucleotide-binding universal stress UspA family protein